MKYAVVGLGAVGNIVGGLLHRNNLDVSFFGKSDQIKVLEEKGLKIKGLNGEILVKNMKTTDNISEIKSADIIFVCVKSQDTKNLAKSLKKYVKKNSILISFQNGVRNKEILKDITGNIVLSSIILFNAVYLRPGEVRLAIKGGVLLEKTKISEKISTDLNQSGLKTIVVNNIKGYQWSKLILNLQIAVTALTGQTIRESITNPDSRDAIIKSMEEGINIVEKSGLKLERLPDADPQKMVKRLKRLNSFLLKIGSRFMGVKENARNSMWQSLERNKKTEIDFINGEIVRLAKKNKLKASVNKKLVKLIKKAEKDNKYRNIKPKKLKKILEI